MMPSVMARPADGPPMFCVCTVTFTGKCQSCCVCGSIPRYAVGLVGAPQPVSTSPLGGVPSVTDLVTIGPLTKSPDAVDGGVLDLERDALAGRQPVQRGNRGSSRW